MLGFLLNPLLVFEPILAITIFAVIILILINLCYRFLVNQQESKQLKEKVKELNKQMKEEQKKGNKERVNELMKETMAEQNKLMRASMKPMLASFVIFILFFPGFLTNNYGDQSVYLQDNKGNITINNDLYLVQLDGDKINMIKDNATKVLALPIKEQIGNNYYLVYHEKQGCMLLFCNPEQIKFARIVAETPVPVPVFPSTTSLITVNKKEFGYIGWYILVSIPFVILIRKMLKIST